MTSGRALLRVVTYNVQGRLWLGPEAHAGVVASVLEEVNGDVLALQEVHPPPSLPPTWTDPRGVEYRVVYGPTLTKARGIFGNAVMTRGPVTAVRQVDLSVAGREPRGALDVEVDVDGLRVRVVATHLGLRAGERAEQVRRLLAHLDDSDVRPIVLLGDINEWRRRGPALRAIQEHFGPSPRAASFPSRWPVFALDRVWTRPGGALVRLETHATPRSARASDHLPVVATVAARGRGGLAG